MHKGSKAQHKCMWRWYYNDKKLSLYKMATAQTAYIQLPLPLHSYLSIHTCTRETRHTHLCIPYSHVYIASSLCETVKLAWRESCRRGFVNLVIYMELHSSEGKGDGKKDQRLHLNSGPTLYRGVSAMRATKTGQDPSSPITLMYRLQVCRYPATLKTCT